MAAHSFRKSIENEMYLVWYISSVTRNSQSCCYWTYPPLCINVCFLFFFFFFVVSSIRLTPTFYHFHCLVSGIIIHLSCGLCAKACPFPRGSSCEETRTKPNRVADTFHMQCCLQPQQLKLLIPCRGKQEQYVYTLIAGSVATCKCLDCILN